jgi:hypothetical protein
MIVSRMIGNDREMWELYLRKRNRKKKKKKNQEREKKGSLFELNIVLHGPIWERAHGTEKSVKGGAS